MPICLLSFMTMSSRKEIVLRGSRLILGWTRSVPESTRRPRPCGHAMRNHCVLPGEIARYRQHALRGVRVLLKPMDGDCGCQTMAVNEVISGVYQRGAHTTAKGRRAFGRSKIRTVLIARVNRTIDSRLALCC